MFSKTIAWADCHEFDESIAQIQQEQVDMHAEQTEIWRVLFHAGKIVIKE